ncbi:MAG: hypothetical protein FWG75_10070 [Cystobacterineae bacterium]|nr:hypothetical protein [Cystobacterineae bacterium]
MENRLLYVSAEEMEALKPVLQADPSLFLAEIDGNMATHLSAYLSWASKRFGFPRPASKIDAYNDWMRDLSWLEKEGYALIIYNYKNFLQQEWAHKKAIMEEFVETILPWWQGEIEKFCVGGKAKPFNVYAVD